MHLNESDLKSILVDMPSDKMYIATRLLLNGLWQNEITTVRIENFNSKTRIMLVQGKRERRIVIDPTTTQLIKQLCRNKRTGRIITLTNSYLSNCLSEICNKHDIKSKQPASDLRKTFISLGIAKGRNAGSVYGQAGQPLKGISLPSLEERTIDFDSKPII